jgi:hypothetical protein
MVYRFNLPCTFPTGAFSAYKITVKRRLFLNFGLKTALCLNFLKFDSRIYRPPDGTPGSSAAGKTG